MVDEPKLLKQSNQTSAKILHTNITIMTYGCWQVHNMERKKTTRHNHPEKISNQESEMLHEFLFTFTISKVTVTVRVGK